MATLTKNHKGEHCRYSEKPLLCQEGVCSECQIYKDWEERICKLWSN